MPFQTTRPTQTLLIPKKRPLLDPVKPTVKVVKQYQLQHHRQALKDDDPTKATTTKKAEKEDKKNQEKEEEEEETQPAEYDFARIPQPFLDPRLWENTKAVDSSYHSFSSSSGTSGSAGISIRGKSEASERGVRETEEEDRKKRVREAEYGGMAVRGRIGLRGAYR